MCNKKIIGMSGFILFAVLINFHVQAQTVVISVKQILDPLKGILAGGKVLIKEGKIIKIGDFPIPSKSIFHNYPNATMMPGLGDSHTHLCTTFSKKDHGDLIEMKNRQRPGLRAMHCVINGKSMLKAGFTMVRDVGNAGEYLDADLSKAIENGVVDGPEIFYSGKIISPFGGQSHALLNVDRLDNGEYIFADTRDELIKAVRQNMFYGADVIKLVSDSQKFFYSQDDIKFVAEMVHKMGLKLAVHASSGEAIMAAVKGGADSIEHGFEAESKHFKLMKKNGTFLSHATMSDEHYAAYAGISPAQVQQKGKSLNFHKQLVKVRKSKIKVAFAADIVAHYEDKGRGQMTIDHIDNYVNAGYSNQEIIRLMTVNVAELLGADEQGQIKPGYFANLILLPGNPLDDIQYLKQIKAVFKRGQLVK